MPSVLVMGLAMLTGCAGPKPSTGLDLTGHAVDPLHEPAARATVLLFTRSDCPISNRYAPEVRRLHAKFQAEVVFWLVYPDPDATSESIRAHMDEYAYDFQALRDPDHTLVALAGATITPEAAVFTEDGTMVYRGRIDDRYVAFGRTRPAPSRHDLEDALEATLAGRPVTDPITDAIGCYIGDLER